MFRATSTFDKLLDKATSNLLLEPDWPSIMQICDLIRQNDVQPKHAINAIKKKLYSPNPHCALYGLQVLESIVKNCGTNVHDEITSKANCEMLRDLAKSTQHENVRQKVLELIQAWTFAFRKATKYRAMKDTMNIMKTEGFKFPTLRESDAMFSADTAPEWTDGDVCHRCRVSFNIIQRKHHCRACGNVFCSQCSQKATTLPKFGIEKEVRVCDACFEQAHKPQPASAGGSTAIDKDKDTDLPAEYLASSLAQQSQSPPKKSEDELREEEELQLALALSQSEAEHKEKEKMRATSALHSNSRHSPVVRSPSPVEEPAMDPELERYLNRSYWESRQVDDADRPASPSAPSPMQSSIMLKPQVNGINISDPEMEEFVHAFKSQVEIFVNRMKSNSSRGRSIANDSSVQTLFMNITAMHSRLLRYIQQQDDARLHYEGLQDKLTQVKDARAALDALREEHREKLRRQAEEAERQRQQQMAQKLEIMRKKKQEYLQYQRQLALQRIQEQEREMQMRQEQQKQQYLMGGAQYGYIGSPVHNSVAPVGQQGPPPPPTQPQQQGPPPPPPGGYPTVPPTTVGMYGPYPPPPQFAHPMMGVAPPPGQQQPQPPPGMGPQMMGHHPPGQSAMAMPNIPPSLMTQLPGPMQRPNAPITGQQTVAPPSHSQSYQPINVPPPGMVPQPQQQQQQQQQPQPQSPENQSTQPKTAELISFD